MKTDLSLGILYALFNFKTIFKRDEWSSTEIPGQCFKTVLR